jgi:hypothetical protein
MSKEVLEKISWKNAARFFGLPEKVARAAAE